MYLEHLTLANFRNYSSLDMNMTPGLLVLHGDNAHGKSNLLEAIHLLATTKPLRAGSDRELVRWEALDGPLAVTRLVGEVRRQPEKIKLEMALGWESKESNSTSEQLSYTSTSPLRKQIKINGVLRRTAEAVGQLNVVIFSSQDVEMISGPPTWRRRYMDITNSQVDRAYFRSLQKYTRILSQRNHLLRLIREGSSNREELTVWNEQLIEEGSYIHCQRRKTICELDRLSQVIYSEVSGGSGSMQLNYLPNFYGENDAGPERVKELFQARLEENIVREVAQGVTVTGPHRDDLQFLVNGKDMGLYGSRGQQRTIAASIKLAEANFLVGVTGEDPVLLLDDILSELDASHRHQVLESVRANEQTFLTTTDLDRIHPEFLPNATLYTVYHGQITQSVVPK